jgi:hypothetical protein
MYPRLVPYRVLLSDIPFASRLRRVGYIVRRASDHFLVACLRSLRLKVQPVCLMNISIHIKQSAMRPHVARRVRETRYRASLP